MTIAEAEGQIRAWYNGERNQPKSGAFTVIEQAIAEGWTLIRLNDAAKELTKYSKLGETGVLKILKDACKEDGT